MPNDCAEDVTGFAHTYPAASKIEDHAHAAHQLVHAVSGSMRVSARGSIWILPPGRAIWIPADITHAIRCKGDVAMRSAYFSRFYEDVPHDPAVVSVSSLARELLIRLSEHPDDPLRHLIGTLLLREIAVGKTAPFSLPLPEDERIAALTLGLIDDPGSARTASAWARKLGFSERNFIRRVRQQTGMTFRELRRQTRILVAIEKLVDGRSVTETAFDVGFETPSAFVAAFRLVTSETPHQFKIKSKPKSMV